MIDLSGQTALVTGASRGIGAAIAHALVDAGAEVPGIGTSIEQNPPAGITARNCDLSDRDQISDLLEVLADTQVDILVNNAGIIRRAPVAKYDIDDWDAVRAVNLDAPFILSQALGSRMVERGHGRIINIASVLSQQGGIMVPSYAVIKAALANLTRSFANEWAISGVNLNAIAPGYVATANTAALQSAPEREAQLMARIPIGRWLRPEEIAAPVVFLASPMASAVHGTILNVDGGWCAR
ncbi:MAG: SDR family oxidoreductase [Thalassospira sp.]|uniref:SDR family oxidoreductase n=1 Tax=Thalassospira sp. TaxID=1912094 RepID=UPI0032ED2572